MKEKFKIQIDNKITEQLLIEDCLNKNHSGYGYNLILLFYALKKSWHINKLNYYINLIEKKNE